MLKIFVLIMVIGGNTSQSGMTTIIHEFNSYETCEKARIALANQWRPNENVPIKYQGCFAK